MSKLSTIKENGGLTTNNLYHLRPHVSNDRFGLTAPFQNPARERQLSVRFRHAQALRECPFLEKTDIRNRAGL
jgi:hypothetical protein